VEENEELVPVASIDLRTVRIRIKEDEGDLILLIDDGEILIEFNSGVCGTWEQAIDGAKWLGDAALSYSESLRARRPALLRRPVARASGS
jgi:hypothetical protein